MQKTKELFSWIKAFVLALMIAFVCRHYIITPSTVHGESMAPTFHNQDKIIISMTTDIERFDTIVFDAPDANKQYIKRVIGLPGDYIEMKDDMLYINGKTIEEPYLKGKTEKIPYEKMTGNFTLKEITGVSIVPEGMVFVLGDNRLNSKDSRSFGFISKEAIIGEVKFKIYPFEKLGRPK